MLPVAPSGGYLTCRSTSGRAYVDTFQCWTQGWRIANSPVTYQFFANDPSSNLSVPLSGIQSSSSISSVLPPTRQLFMRLVDSSNAIAYAFLNMNVYYQNSSAVFAQVTSLLQGS